VICSKKDTWFTADTRKSVNERSDVMTLKYADRDEVKLTNIKHFEKQSSHDKLHFKGHRKNASNS